MYEILFYNLDLFFFFQAMVYTFCIIFLYQVYNRTRDKGYYYSIISIVILLLNIFYAVFSRVMSWDYDVRVRLLLFIILSFLIYFINKSGKHPYFFRSFLLLILFISDFTHDWLYREIFAALVVIVLFVVCFIDLRKIKSKMEMIRLRRIFILFIVLLSISFLLILKVGQKDFQRYYQRTEKQLNDLRKEIEDEINKIIGILKIFPDNKMISYMKDSVENNIEYKQQIYDRLDELISYNPGSIVYIMNMNGRVIISSNRDEKDNFEGKNFNFRPYFKNSIYGRDFAYMAIGKVSGKRGLYVSTPLFDEQNEIVGVLVLKRPMHIFDRLLQEYTYIVGKEDLIFSASDKDDILRFLSPRDIGSINKLRDDQQFFLEEFKEPLFSDKVIPGKIVLDKRSGIWENLLPVSVPLSVKDFKLMRLQRFTGLHERRLLLDIFLFFSLFFIFAMISYYENIRFMMKRLRSSENNLADTLDLMPVMVFETDSELDLIYYNKMFVDFFDIREDVNNLREVIHEDSLSEIMFIFSKIKASPFQELGLSLIKKNGEKKELILSSSRFKRRSKKLYRIVLTDVTGNKRLIEKIKHTNDKYQYTLTSFPVPLIEIDLNEEIQFINDSFREEFDFGQRLPVAMDSVFSGRSIGVIRRAYRKVLNGERVDNIELEQKKDEKTKYFLASGIPLYEKGQLIKVRFVLNNITSLVRYEHEVNELFTAVDRSPVGISIHTPEFATIYCNPMMEKITGYSKYEMIGNTTGIFGTEPLKLDKDWEGEVIIKDKEGNKKTVYQKVAPVFSPDSTLTGYVSIIIDISDIKELEKDLIRSRKEAEHLSESRRLLMMKLSHEINTPLNQIINISEIALENIVKKDVSKELIKIKHEGELLHHIIKNILVLSELEMNQYISDHKKTRLMDVINNIIENYNEIIREKDIKVETNIGDIANKEIKIDLKAFELVANNLISNALKYMKTGTVVISLSEDLKRDDILLFSVKDNGEGIDKSRQSLIFEPFFQEDDSTNRSYQGLGLGLPIVKKVLSCIGGEIFLESHKGTGSIFRARIPFERTNGNIYVKEDNQNSDIKILVVDDARENRFIVKTYLSKLGIRPDEATGGEEALDLINRKEYDIILLDIQMPGIDGYGVLSETRDIEQRRDKKAYIVALTAHSLAKDVEKAKNRGFDEYISKPIRKKEFLMRIKEIIGRINI